MTTHVFQAVLEGALIAALIAVLIAGTAFAAKGGNGGGNSTHQSGGGGGKHHQNTTYTGTLSAPIMVTDVNGDGLPNYGDQITFDVTSNATYYFVEVDCSQNGTVVYRQTNGFYPGWPWSQDYTLTSTAWFGGAAACTATLYSSYSDGSNRQDITSEAFGVGS